MSGIFSTPSMIMCFVITCISWNRYGNNTVFFGEKLDIMFWFKYGLVLNDLKWLKRFFSKSFDLGKISQDLIPTFLSLNITKPYKIQFNFIVTNE
mgnify:CR=1 FL=1